MLTVSPAASWAKSWSVGDGLELGEGEANFLACVCSDLHYRQQPPSRDQFQSQIVAHLHEKSHISDTSG